MISELTDEEILNFLMTSEFEQDYKPEEYKYLLNKWRYFYRVLHGKNEISKTDFDFEKSKLNEDLEAKQNLINNLLMSSVQKDEQIESLKSRKLTWKERISGKIINTQNENQ